MMYHLTQRHADLCFQGGWFYDHEYMATSACSPIALVFNTELLKSHALIVTNTLNACLNTIENSS